MGVGAGLYMCDVVKKFTFAVSSPDEFLSYYFVPGMGGKYCDERVCMCVCLSGRISQQELIRR